MKVSLTLRTRATELSPEARLIIAKFLREMRAHMPGEILKLYVPKRDAVEQAAQRRRIARALMAGESPATIAKREGVSDSMVVKMRRRLRGSIGTLPP